MNYLTHYFIQYLFLDLFLTTFSLLDSPCVTYARFMNTGTPVSNTEHSARIRTAINVTQCVRQPELRP